MVTLMPLGGGEFFILGSRYAAFYRPPARCHPEQGEGTEPVREGSVLLFNGQAAKRAKRNPNKEPNSKSRLVGAPHRGARDAKPNRDDTDHRRKGRGSQKRFFTPTGRAGQCPAPTSVRFCRRWPGQYVHNKTQKLPRTSPSAAAAVSLVL